MGYFSIILPYLWNGDVPWCFDYIFWEQTDDFVPFKRPRGKRWRLRGEKLTWQIKLGWQTKSASQEIVSIWKIVYSLIIATHIKWWLSSYTWGNPKICLTILHLIHCLSHCFYCWNSIALLMISSSWTQQTSTGVTEMIKDILKVSAGNWREFLFSLPTGGKKKISFFQ